MKLILCPLIVLFVDLITRDVFYSSWLFAVMVGLLIAGVGYMLDSLILRRGTLWIATIIDFFVVAVIAFLSQFVIYDAFVTMAGALLIASLIAISEYIIHRWLILGGHTDKAA